MFFKFSKRQMKPIVSMVPGFEPIELVEYYEEFSNYYHSCEMDTKDWFVKNIKPDWVIFDCGANIGYFSILFARLSYSGHVYAFEPTSTYDMLVKNLEHHRIQNVTPLKLALGNQSMKKKDAIFRIWGGKPERKEYSFITIDDFVKQRHIEKVNCIKIDVDSFDFEVLQGAQETLLSQNPYVMVELNHALNKRGQSNMQALEWLLSIGYTEARVLDYDNFLLKRGLKQFADDLSHMKLFFT